MGKGRKHFTPEEKVAILRRHRGENRPEWKGFHPELYAFVTPLVPSYAPKAYKDKHWPQKNFIDYSHERECSVPHTFSFKWTQVEFVILPDYDTIANFPKPLKNAIGRKKFIMLGVYPQLRNYGPFI